MEEMRLIHIAAGTLSIAAGTTALMMRKGAPAHRAAGSVFVISMITMSTTAAIIGAEDIGNVVAGALTIYAVATGWATARRKEKTAGLFEGATGFVALACALGGYYSAYLIASGAKLADNPYIVTATIILSSVLGLAAIGDFSVVLRRGLAGRQRIARHLWRMCLGLVIAVGSFAAQGARILPDWFPAGKAILASLSLVIATMAFWLMRVFFTGWHEQSARALSTVKEKPMSGGLFPEQFDNDYRGRRLALWLLAPIIFVKAAMGANTVLNTRNVIESADSIPLGEFGPGAQETIIFMYQAWGLCLLLMAMLGLVALVRYRSMTPLVFLLLAAENIGRRAIYMADPFSFAALPSTPTPGALINLALMATLAVGFVLSLWKQKDPNAEAA